MEEKKLSRESLLQLAKSLDELRSRYKYNFIQTVFQDEGKYRRELYPKHVEFLNGGRTYAERLFCAANQVGKTLTLLSEGYYHASGRYPHWWKGKVFKRPTVGIFGAQTWDQLRVGIQAKLLTGADRGDLERGTGLIPRDTLDKCVFLSAPNVPGAYSEIHIPHVTGGYSKIIFKTYDSGQRKWESMTVHWVMLDEEPPFDIYTEAAMRVIKNDGTIAIGFTPDDKHGLTDTVLHFFKDGDFFSGAKDDKYVAIVGWDDVPHLSERAKAAARQTIPEYLLEAKTKGIPFLGAGRVFSFDLNKFVSEPFSIPEYYKLCFAIDPGVKNVAVLWGAIDPDTKIMYVYKEYGAHNTSVYTVIDVLKSKDEWIPGVMDPFYGPQSSRESAIKIIDLYKGSGVDVELCDRKGKDYKEGGIEAMKVAFLTGKLVIFNTCRGLINQINMYHRRFDGKTSNTPDDFVDCLRYLVTGGVERAESYIDRVSRKDRYSTDFEMAKRNRITGY
jgi:phage terminase large subunit-like protein